MALVYEPEAEAPCCRDFWVRAMAVFLLPTRVMTRLTNPLSAVLLVGLASAAGCSSSEMDPPPEPANPADPAAGPGVDAGQNTGSDASVAAPQTFTIEPAVLQVVVDRRDFALTQPFEARLNGEPVEASWSLSNYDAATIDQTGRFSLAGLHAGTVTVTASRGNLLSTANVEVVVNLVEDVVVAGAAAPSAEDKLTLAGVPELEPDAGGSKLLYPYPGTVMPGGLVAPLVQMSAGQNAADAVKLTLSTEAVHWTGHYDVSNPAAVRATIPQDVWDMVVSTAKNKRVDVSVVKASNGKAYGPATTYVQIADGSLRGSVFYQTYANGGEMWVTRPGSTEPANRIADGCRVCHSASPNGKWLAVGAHDSTSGIYRINSDATITKTATAPALGGDSRGLSFAAFASTPGGTDYVTRSQNNFWGGQNQLAWKITESGEMTSASVSGLQGVSAYVPAFSPDATRYAFTTGQGDTEGATVSRSLNVMDVNVDDATDTLTFSNRRVLIDNGVMGDVPKFATFLPDNKHIVFQEGGNVRAAYGAMLPTHGASGPARGRVHMIDSTTGQRIELENANRGLTDAELDKNYEPFALPVPAAGYYWFVFTSTRDYGNVYVGRNARKQLWVSAVAINPAPGQDPSSPPFYLPTQTETTNERGVYVLDACMIELEPCEQQSDCCAGDGTVCAPVDHADPSAGKVCKQPQNECVGIGGSCTATADCCHAGGVTCQDNVCAAPVIL